MSDQSLPATNSTRQANQNATGKSIFGITFCFAEQLSEFRGKMPTAIW